MNQALAGLGLALFAALPPAVLLARYRVGPSLPWWAVAVIVAGGGWLTINLGNHFYGEYACEAVRGVVNPPAEALARCTDDGARDVHALLFGWLYALVYALPFHALFALSASVRRRRSPH